MADRITNVKEKMAELGLDAYLINSNENKCYLVNFEDESVATGVDSFLLLTKNVDYLIVEVADIERAAWTCPGCTILPVADK